jgi:hypothetical protein
VNTAAYLMIDSTYCEAIPFRSDAKSRVVYASTRSPAPWTLMNEPISSLHMFVTPLGLVRLDAVTDKIAQDK